ncbi:MAG: hypothetical protein V4692_03215 [Bdellovibrionota bacterium]
MRNSNPSVPMLDAAMSKFFESRSSESFKMVRGTDQTWPQTKNTIDVVLYSSAVARLTDRRLWNVRQKYRLWTLSSRLSHLITEMSGIPSANVGTIDRYQLFRAKNLKYDLESSDSFVVANRAAPGKNSYLSLALAMSLKSQKRYSKHRIYICGPSLPKSPLSNEFKDVEVLGDLGKNWVREIPARRPVLISLSLLPNEDFGVSIAQAQASGMPVIISDWYGHGDVHRAGVYKITAKTLMEADKKKSISVVGRLLSTALKESREPNASVFQNREPEIISGSKIIKSIDHISADNLVELSVYFEPGTNQFSRIELCPRVRDFLSGGF